MNINEHMVCPNCNGTHFTVKREATYIYTYNIEPPDTADREGHEDSLPFLFDNREQVNNKEYLRCEQCGAQYPCDIDRQQGKLQFTIIRKAIRADHQQNPEFLG